MCAMGTKASRGRSEADSTVFGHMKLEKLKMRFSVRHPRTADVFNFLLFSSSKFLSLQKYIQLKLIRKNLLMRILI